MSDQKELKDEELEEAIQLISKGAKMLGFCIAIPSGLDEDQPVEGLILGTEKYVDEMCECHKKLFGGKIEQSE